MIKRILLLSFSFAQATFAAEALKVGDIVYDPAQAKTGRVISVSPNGYVNIRATTLKGVNRGVPLFEDQYSDVYGDYPLVLNNVEAKSLMRASDVIPIGSPVFAFTSDGTFDGYIGQSFFAENGRTGVVYAFDKDGHLALKRIPEDKLFTEPLSHCLTEKNITVCNGNTVEREVAGKVRKGIVQTVLANGSKKIAKLHFETGDGGAGLTVMEDIAQVKVVSGRPDNVVRTEAEVEEMSKLPHNFTTGQF